MTYYGELICHNGRSHTKSLNLIRTNVCTKNFKFQDIINCLDNLLKLINLVGVK